MRNSSAGKFSSMGLKRATSDVGWASASAETEERREELAELEELAEELAEEPAEEPAELAGRSWAPLGSRPGPRSAAGMAAVPPGGPVSRTPIKWSASKPAADGRLAWKSSTGNWRPEV
mmetsp:Transcript_79786/g.247491  ORF Transcript_79786/g.247491 Transcript_79786/m.247491 type:complete len:119 (+) Transcript_79786:606-962(+)